MKKQTKKPPIKKPGVKPGQKRGPYKKTNKNNNSFSEPLNIKAEDPINEPVNEHVNEPIKEPLNEPINEPVKETTENDPFNEQFESFVNENKTDTEFKEEPKTEHQQTQINQQSFNNTQNLKSGLNNLVTGYMLLTFMDVLFPFAIIKIAGFAIKDFNKLGIKAKELKLDKDQKEALEASADEVAKYLFAQMNPLTVFFVGSALFYGQNLTEQINAKKLEK